MKTFASLFSIILTISSLAQENWVKPFLNADVRFTEHVDLSNLDDHQLFVATPYAQSDFINAHVLDGLKGQITSIDLVYSDFQRAATFDQNGLNAQRAKELFGHIPEVFADKLIIWSLVGQTGCESHASCAGLPHGFLITYRPLQDDDVAIGDIDYLNARTGRLGIYTELTSSDGSSIPYLMDRDAWFPGGMAGFSHYVEQHTAIAILPRKLTTYHVEFTIGREGRLVDLKIDGGGSRSVIDAISDCLHAMPDWSPAIRKGEAISARKRMIVTVDEVGGEPVINALVTAPGDPVVALESLMDEYRVAAQDPVVGAAFSRNHWQNEAVVMDVTGSMSPYSAQLMVWLKLRSRESLDLVVFNDGDGAYDGQKMIGKTGGISSKENCGFNEAMTLTMDRMRAGSGGDLIENDVEALLRAQSQFTDCQSIILIADNWNAPRDLELVDQIEKPVRVVLCGARGGVNPKYLDMARATGGSVHVIEKDILDLALMMEGEEIEIQGQTYTLKDGKFVR